MIGKPGSRACAHSVAHESHKPTTNTPKHTADLRSVSQNPIHQLAIGVFSGTGLLDMLDSARHAIKTKTQKSESVSLANSVKAFQKGCQRFVGHCQFFFG